MTTATYTLEVDWDGDGAFEGGSEDISADWIIATITRGFSDPLTRVAQVGRATFLLKNSAQTYSPELNADALPRRQVKFTMTYSAVSVVLFRGYVEEIQPTSGPKFERQCTLECVDAMALLDLHSGATAMQFSVRADEIIEDVVAAVYTPPATNYEAGLAVYPFSSDKWSEVEGHGIGYEEVVASQKIKDACASDWGRFFISKSGAPTFFNRHNMSLNSGAADLTASDTMKKLGYRKGVTKIYNEVEVKFSPRAVGTTYEVLSRSNSDKPIRVEAGASTIVTLYYRDPSNKSVKIGGYNILTPVAGTDFTATNDEEGEGTDNTGSITPSLTAYSDRAVITLANGSGEILYVHDLKVRGYAVRVRDEVSIAVSDATSINKYQRRKLPVSAPLLNSDSAAKRLADYLLALYKDPRPIVTGVELLANRSTTLLAAARDLELMDKASVTETQTGLSSYVAFIYSMTHTINRKYEHWLTLALEKLDITSNPFRLDTSALNSGDVLVF